MKRLQIWLMVTVLCTGRCTQKQADAPITAEAENEKYLTSIDDFSSHPATVISFLGPECPLSENYTKTLNDLQEQFSDADVRFIAVFPGTHYSTAAIDSFIAYYRVQQEVYLDKDFALVKKLQATVTPETCIFDHTGKVVYSGAIDNWAVDLGQKRQVITEFYVRDVLRSMLDHTPLPYQKTTPVGCIIETDAHVHH